MRFHFGQCRHDEAQKNWNDLCKANDQILEEQMKYNSLYKEHSAYLSVCETKLKHLQEVIDDLKKQQLMTQPPYIDLPPLYPTGPDICSFIEKPKKRKS